MATQCTRVAVLILLGLISVTSPAAINLGTSLGNGDDLNQVKSRDLEVNEDFGDLELLVRKSEDSPLPVEEEKPYVDASVFRQQSSQVPFDAIKPKASFFVKKSVPEVSKHAKNEHDAKKAISIKLEPPAVEETTSEVEENRSFFHILSAIRKFIEVAGHTIVRSLSSDTTTLTPDLETTTTTTTTTTTASSGTSAPANENEELPRLSPPIWSHSSEAEALSDPLRLPLVEPYDRYDRYSHSIARDIVW